MFLRQIVRALGRALTNLTRDRKLEYRIDSHICTYLISASKTRHRESRTLEQDILRSTACINSVFAVSIISANAEMKWLWNAFGSKFPRKLDQQR